MPARTSTAQRDRPVLAHCGAYGFRLTGLGQGALLLGEASPLWPELAIRAESEAAAASRVVDGDDALVEYADDSAVIHLLAGRIELNRSPLSAVLQLSRLPTLHELLHPYLGAIAAVAARWLGRDAVHAGAFIHEGAAWGVLGGRNSGKSSLLARLALDGIEVVADDVLVIDAGRALPAPRFIDLRADAADRLGVGEQLGRVGARERWRMPLAAEVPIAPLRGWIRLGWGDEAELLSVPPAERLLSLAPQLSVGAPPLDPAALIELAALPMLEFRRPRDWESLGESCRGLLHGLVSFG